MSLLCLYWELWCVHWSTFLVHSKLFLSGRSTWSVSFANWMQSPPVVGSLQKWGLLVSHKQSGAALDRSHSACYVQMGSAHLEWIPLLGIMQEWAHTVLELCGIMPNPTSLSFLPLLAPLVNEHASHQRQKKAFGYTWEFLLPLFDPDLASQV